MLGVDLKLPSVKEFEGFVKQYPTDGRAFDFLVQSPPEVLVKVLSDFRPHKKGQADYSALLTVFVKKVRGRYERGDRARRKLEERSEGMEVVA